MLSIFDQDVMNINHQYDQNLFLSSVIFSTNHEANGFNHHNHQGNLDQNVVNVD